MMLTPKVKGALVISSGGIGAASVTSALYTQQDKLSAPSNESAEIDHNLQIISEELTTDNKDLPIKSLVPAQEEIEKIDHSFSVIGDEINKGYKNSQKNLDQNGGGLSWKEEFKSILEKESFSLQSIGKINTNQWKDCSAIGGKDDYCGYLDMEIGEIKYRVKVDKYGLGQPQNGDVTIVRNNMGKIEGYSGNEKIGKVTNKQDLEMYQGESKARENGWSKLSEKSIEIKKSRK